MLEKLTKKQADILTAILILIIIGIIAFWMNLWLSPKKVTPPPVVEKPALKIEEISESLKPGEIGEPKEGEKPQIELPPVISGTGGTIKEIKKDRLIILGDGSNFSDQKQRDLTLILTDSTITFEPGQKSKYQGFEGLKHLKVDDLIAVSSIENIRGKTEFIVNYINKF